MTNDDSVDREKARKASQYADDVKERLSLTHMTERDVKEAWKATRSLLNQLEIALDMDPGEAKTIDR